LRGRYQKVSISSLHIGKGAAETFLEAAQRDAHICFYENVKNRESVVWWIIGAMSDVGL
jgi:hypothetical protein